MLRWSGADLEHDVAGDGAEAEWAERFQQYAAAAGRAGAWEKAHCRFVRWFPVAVQRAHAVLRETGEVDDGFVAVAMDEEACSYP